MRYVYLGDGLTDPRFVNQPRNQLVRFTNGEQVVVRARLLRLTP